jgi:4-amino-4-deoxy-L-arabinose transferase-like glycosyltransferase
VNRSSLRLGPILAVIVAVALWLVAPEIYTGTFSDVGTFLTVLALGAAVALWVVLVRRFVTHRPFRLALIVIPLGALAFAVLWPYLRPPTEVDEAFPSAVSAASPPTTTTTSSTLPSTATAPVDNDAATSTTSTSTTTTTTTTTTVPPEPVELARASFQGLTGHRGSGDAAVYRLGDDSILLRFEEVDIGSGPDLNVWLVPGEDQRRLGGGTFVAPLTAERGNQNYEIPEGIDLTDGVWTVLVWCDTFSVEVANATL